MYIKESILNKPNKQQFSGTFNKFTTQNDITWLAKARLEKRKQEGNQKRLKYKSFTN